MKTSIPRSLLSVAPVLAAGAWCAAAGAQPAEPSDTEGIGITEHLNGQVPLDLIFTDERGVAAPLGDFFGDGKPVMLTLVYYRCPSICNVMLNGLSQTLGDLEWSAGEEFRIVTVSIDPNESYELAAGKKRSYLDMYDRPSAEQGWRFLVGEQASIEALADAVGFGYRLESTGIYTHAASLMICTPDGRLSRYINDVVFEPDTLQLALAEASAGTIGTPVDRFLLKWCYTYDPATGKYVVAARKVMTIAGALMVVVMGAGLAFLWRRELRRKEDGASQRRRQLAAEPHS